MKKEMIKVIKCKIKIIFPYKYKVNKKKIIFLKNNIIIKQMN